MKKLSSLEMFGYNVSVTHCFEKYRMEFECIVEGIINKSYWNVHFFKTKNNCLQIILADPYCTPYCNTTEFSCYDSQRNIIFINAHNWFGKPQNFLHIDDYRTYLINHEIGHFLGLQHEYKCINGIAPVMMQQTKKISCCPNFKPLRHEIKKLNKTSS